MPKYFSTFAVWSIASLVCLFGSLGLASADAIKVFTAELPPFVTEENGRASGSLGEILSEMGRRANIELEFEFLPWQRSQLQAENTPNALILALGRSPAREQRYNWIAKTITTNELFVTLGPRIDTLEQARGLSGITVLAGSPRARKLSEASFENVYISRNTDIAVGMLINERVSAWYTLDHRAAFAAKSIGVSPSEFTMGRPLASIDLWIASNKEFDPDIEAKLVDAIDKMRDDGVLQGIVDKYTK